MWHTDYTESDDGKQIILYEDDASRCIMGYGQFDNATTDNAILVFDDAVELCRIAPRELLTDHGSQFCEDENKEYRFRKHITSELLCCITNVRASHFPNLILLGPFFFHAIPAS